MINENSTQFKRSQAEFKRGPFPLLLFASFEIFVATEVGGGRTFQKGPTSGGQISPVSYANGQ